MTYISHAEDARLRPVPCLIRLEYYNTINDPEITLFEDTSVVQGHTYCYRVTFTHLDCCDQTTVYESPFSNIDCNQLCNFTNMGPMDVTFIIDNTGSMGDQPLTQLRNGINKVLDDIQAASGNDYRLAIVTPDNDQVHVWLDFSSDNRSAFTSALNSVTPSGGGNTPESTDECLNTVLNALAASGRSNPRNCTPVSSPLQIGDFSPAMRSNVKKFVVMITDAEPGGFCDFGDNGAQAAIYAQQAKNNCVKINAIQVNLSGDGPDPACQTVMLNYEHVTCGWYSDIPHDGTGVADAVDRMLYTASFCNCP